MNILPHLEHWWRSLPVCSRKCPISVSLVPNDLSQKAQEYGLSWTWSLACTCNSSIVLKHRLHFTHWCGFSTLWIKAWFFKLSSRRNERSQSSHLYGSSLFCVTSDMVEIPCFWSSVATATTLPLMSRLTCCLDLVTEELWLLSSHWCTFICTFRWVTLANTLWHFVHG